MDNWDRANKLETRVYKIDDGGGAAPPGYGLCSSCSRFRWFVTRYGTESAKCSADDTPWTVKRLRKDDPVASCSQYGRNGELSLKEMLDMATLIDVNRNQIGFGTETATVTIRTPTEDDE